jgi:hypothetical protein
MRRRAASLRYEGNRHADPGAARNSLRGNLFDASHVADAKGQSGARPAVSLST